MKEDTLQYLLRNRLDIETLAIIMLALDLRPSMQRAIAMHVWMNKTPVEVIKETGVSRTALYRHMRLIREKFIRG